MTEEMKTLESFLKLTSEEKISLIGNNHRLVLKVEGAPVEYEIIRTQEQLFNFLDECRQHRLNQYQNAVSRIGGPPVAFERHGIVTFELKNNPELELWFTNAQNLIFIKSLSLGENTNHRYFDFTKCTFCGFVSLGQKGNYNSDLSLRFVGCSVYSYVSVLMNVNFIEVRNTKFFNSQGLLIHEAKGNSLNIYGSELFGQISSSSFEKISISDNTCVKSFLFNRVYVEKRFEATNLQLPQGSHLTFSEFQVLGNSYLKFSKSLGKIRIESSGFGDCSWDYESISENNFDCLKVIQGDKAQHLLTSQNYSTLHKIAKNSGDTKEKLEFEYLMKRERLRDRKKKSFSGVNVLDWFYWISRKTSEIAFCYFCIWYRLLCTILAVIIAFGLLYAGNFDQINAGDNDADDYLGRLGSSIYFSVITFATVGYGDVAPCADSIFRYIAGFEGLIGVVLTSLLTVSIVRRYVD